MKEFKESALANDKQNKVIIIRKYCILSPIQWGRLSTNCVILVLMAVVKPLSPSKCEIPEEHLSTLAALYEFEADIINKAGRVGEFVHPSCQYQRSMHYSHLE